MMFLIVFELFLGDRKELGGKFETWFGGKPEYRPKATLIPNASHPEMAVHLPHTNDPSWEAKERLLREITPSSMKLVQLLNDLHPKSNLKLDGLFDYLEHHLDRSVRNKFFTNVLPGIQRLACELPRIFTDPLERLRPQSAQTVQITREQGSILLAAAFFGLMNTKIGAPEGEIYPSFSLFGLYAPHARNYRCSSVQAGKLNCFLHYLYRVINEPPQGTLTFTRRCCFEWPEWDKCDEELQALEVFERGSIEDDIGSAHVDFANRVLGGGVFGRGSVQEEIMFCIYPELSISRLLCAQLEDNECLIMHGAERFCNYEGYGDSFEFGGAYRDQMWPRTVVAIDALNLYGMNENAQFSKRFMLRELNKAYIGFNRLEIPVATGRWGCGAFRGDDQLKAVLQLLAAAVARVPMRFYCFDHPELAAGLRSLHAHLTGKHTTVARIWESLGHVLALRQADFDDDSHENDEMDDNVFSILMESI